MADSNPKVFVLAGAMVMMMVSGAVFYFMLQAQPVEEAHAPDRPRAVEARVDRGSASTPAPPPAPAEAPVEVPAPATRDGDKAGPSKSQRMSRDLKREQIWSKLRDAHELDAPTPGSPAPAKDQLEGLPQLDPEYIQSAIREQLVPVAIECYESALEDDPELAGQLLVEFTIVGAEEVGGVVEDALIQDDSTLENAFVRECIRESVMAVSFEPPEAGGQVKVVYPLNFEPE